MTHFMLDTYCGIVV